MGVACILMHMRTRVRNSATKRQTNTVELCHFFLMIREEALTHENKSEINFQARTSSSNPKKPILDKVDSHQCSNSDHPTEAHHLSNNGCLDPVLHIRPTDRFRAADQSLIQAGAATHRCRLTEDKKLTTFNSGVQFGVL
eukprot:369687_1